MFFSSESVEPTFVNDIGTKWYLDKEVTKYIWKKLQDKKYMVWFVRDASNRTDRVITDGKEVIYCSQSLEGLYVRIDLMKADKEFPK